MAVVSATPDEEQRPANVRVYLPNKDKVIEGFSEIGPGKDVTLTIKGKVRSFSDWSFENGVDFEVTPDSVSVSTEDQVVSLDDAINESQKTA